MTILVDEARWEWRGERWAHLVSDVSIDELHGFARTIGLRYLSFQGDHYDVPLPLRARAIAHGATVVTSRELVRRLVVSGLRRRGVRSDTAWSRLAQWPGPGLGVDAVTEALSPVGVESPELVAGVVVKATRTVEPDHVSLFRRPGEGVALLAGGRHDVAAPEAQSGIELVNDTLDGSRRILELVVRGSSPPGYRSRP